VHARETVVDCEVICVCVEREALSKVQHICWEYMHIVIYFV
jgi:hypothetical protein